MNCERIRELLNGYVDGELSEVEQRLVAEHLANCPVCLEQERSYAMVRDLAARCGRETAPRGFDEALKVKLESERFRARPARRFSVSGRLALAATFALVLLTGALIGLFAIKPGGHIGPGDNFTTPMIASDSHESAAKSESLTAPVTPTEVPEPETTDRYTDSDIAAGAAPAEAGDAAVSVVTQPEADAFSAYDTSPPGPEPAPNVVSPVYLGRSEESRMAAEAIAEYQTMRRREERVEEAEGMLAEDTAAPAKSAPAKIQPESAAPMTSARITPPRPITSPHAGAASAPVPASAIQPVSTGANTAGNEMFTMGVIRPVSPPDVSATAMALFDGDAASGKMDAYMVELPGGDRVIYKFKSRATGAGDTAAPPAAQVARAADTYAVADPAKSAEACEKLVFGALENQPGAGAQWQRQGNRIIVKGAFGLLRPLRLDILRKFNPAQADAFAAAEAAALATGRDAAGNSVPTFTDDMHAILEVRFVATPPAQPQPAASTPADR